MEIKGSIATKGPSMPAILADRVQLRACCVLADEEITALQAVLDCLAKYVSASPPVSGARCTAVLLDRQTVSLSPTDELGAHFPLVVIWLGRIRPRADYSKELVMLVFAEELCHALYLEQNEHAVKERVFDVLAPYSKVWLLHDVYPAMFAPDGRRIELPNA